MRTVIGPAVWDTKYIDNLISTIEGVHAHKKAKGSLSKSDSLFYELLGKHYRRLRYAKENGEFTVGLLNMAFTELVTVLGLVPYNVWQIPFAVALTNGNLTGEALGVAQQLGMHPELCSSNRLYVAMVAMGAIPKPQVLVGGRPLCDNTLVGCEVAADLMGIPGFPIDRPYRCTDAGIRIAASELQDLVKFLEEHSGRKLDPVRFKEMVKRTRQYLQLRHEIFELRRAVPTPMPSRKLMHLEVMDFDYAGTIEGLEYYECVRDELKAMVDTGKGALPEERFRIFAVWRPPAHALNAIVDWWERDMKAVCVGEFVGHTSLAVEAHELMDENKPWEGLARKAFFAYEGWQSLQPGEIWVNDILQQVRESKADGVVWFVTVGCNHGAAVVRMVRDALAETGIPTLFVDVDYVDPTFCTADEMLEKCQDFFARLEERKN